MHDYLIAELQARKGTWPAIAEATGISVRTIEKIARREIIDPGITHVETLIAHFQGAPWTPQCRPLDVAG